MIQWREREVSQERSELAENRKIPDGDRAPRRFDGWSAVEC